ncbi:MAG: dihydropteroate synthase, partial [Acidobacteria bacterium]|nr:dihydropteroate synthase [Acidobacteriota bacterium]
FSEGGEYFDRERAVSRGKAIEQEGADILDIGGESTRPGSEAVDEMEEERRVLPVIEALAGVIQIPISIDTYRARSARGAIDAGAQIVNDISGFRFDDEMPRLAKQSGAGVVLMHSRGDRQSLHRQNPMDDPVSEVRRGLAASVEKAVAAGIPGAAVVVDPGIGFGKTAAESLKVLKSLSEFSKLGYPLLAGTSRKSFIRLIVQDATEARSWGTAATVVAAILNGAHIVRVHDVRQARVLADVTDQLTC